MACEISVVVTAYGRGGGIDTIVVNFFDQPESYFGKNYPPNKTTYCEALNRLELEGDSWVRASVVEQDYCYAPEEFLPPGFKTSFEAALFSITDWGMQFLLRSIKSSDLTDAMRGTSREARDKVFRGMTKGAAQALREDLAYNGKTSQEEVSLARNRIAGVIHHLRNNGHILRNKKREEG